MSYLVPAITTRVDPCGGRWLAKLLRLAACAAVCTVVASGTAARAQVSGIWTDTTGANDGLFTSGANWIGGSPPTGGLNTTLTFGVTSGVTTLTQDLASPFLLNKITFTADGALSSQYTLNGGEFRFDGTSPAIWVTGATTTNSMAQTINNHLSFVGGDFSLQVDGSNLNSLRINGNITATGGVVSTLNLLGTSTNGSNVIAGQLLEANGSTLSILKSGSGVWNVTSNNVLSGGVAITSGTLNMSGDNTFVSGVTVGGGALILSGDNILSAATITTGTLTMSGANTLTGGVSIGGGALVMSGSNSISGGVSISAGTGSLSGVNTIGGPIEVNGGTLTFGGASTFNGPATVSAGTLVLGASALPSSQGIWVNGGTLRASAPGALEFGNAPVQLGSIANLATALSYSSATAGNLTRSLSLAGTGTFTISADGAGALTVLNTFNYLDAGARTMVLAGGGAGFNEYQSQLTDVGGALSLRKSGAGTWVVTNTANNFTGGTTILAGSLRVTDLNAQLLAAGSLRFGTTAGTIGVLETSGSLTTSLGTGVGQLSFGTNVVTQHSGGFSAFGGPLSVTLNNNASTPIIWGGVLAAGNLTTTTELQFNSPDATDIVTFHNNITLSATGITQSHRINVADNPALTSDWAVMSGNISGSGGLAKLGTGMLVLSGNNTYTGGTTIISGIVQVGNATTNLNRTANALRFSGTNNGTAGVLQTSGALNFAGLGIAAGQVSWLANGSGGFSAFGGTLSVTLTTDTVTPIVWGTVPFINGTSELILSSTNADNVVTFNNSINFGNGVRSVRVYDNTTTTDDYAVIAGGLTGSGGINKLGTGLLVLTGNNTFTGGATITGACCGPGPICRRT